MHVILRGADHTELDRTAVHGLDADVGIALSRGRHAKRYPHTAPNEDVVAAHRVGGTTAMVVADGHSGMDASHAAVDAVLDLIADEIPVWDRREAVLAFHAVNERIRQARRATTGPGGRSRTTLVVATVATDPSGQRLLTHASVGDSAVFVVRDGTAHQVTRDRHHFLGERLSAPQVAGAMDHGQTGLEPDDLVVVVSDGYTSFASPHHLGGLTAVPPDAIAGPDPTALAAHVVDLAGDAGAGDNVAVAVLLPPTAL